MQEEELYQEFLEGPVLQILPVPFVDDLVIHRFSFRGGFCMSVI